MHRTAATGITGELLLPPLSCISAVGDTSRAMMVFINLPGVSDCACALGKWAWLDQVSKTMASPASDEEGKVLEALRKAYVSTPQYTDTLYCERTVKK